MHDCQDLRRLQNDTQVELDTSQDKRIVYYMIFRTLSSWQNCMARLNIKHRDHTALLLSSCK